jgi:hypothetical protein
MASNPNPQPATPPSEPAPGPVFAPVPFALLQDSLTDTHSTPSDEYSLSHGPDFDSEQDFSSEHDSDSDYGDDDDDDYDDNLDDEMDLWVAMWARMWIDMWGDSNDEGENIDAYDEHALFDDSDSESEDESAPRSFWA